LLRIYRYVYIYIYIHIHIHTAALDSDNPDLSLPKHSRFAFKNGEIRKLDYLVKPSELLVTGQTQAEADAMYRYLYI
jgi:hypothetical protein